MPSYQELISMGVDPAIARAYASANNTPAPGQGDPNQGTSTTTPNINTGSSSASGQGYTTSGPAQPGQAGSLNVPSTEGGPAPPPPDGGTAPPPTPPPPPPLDWQAYLANWGFTPDIIARLTTIFSTYTDPAQASAAALAYIRGTDWYSQTFPGIQNAERLGLVSDEQGYRSYVNDLNQFYQRYYQRNVTTQETLDALNAGHNPNQVGAHLAGQAYIAANQNDINYTTGAFDDKGRFTTDELNSLGDQTEGLDNMIGPDLQRRLAVAKQRMQTIFQGQLTTPSLSVLNSGRLAASGLGASSTPDIQA